MKSIRVLFVLIPVALLGIALIGVWYAWDASRQLTWEEAVDECGKKFLPYAGQVSNDVLIMKVGDCARARTK